MTALKRPIHAMTLEVEQALEASDLRAAYDARPAYQRNDYLGWIDQAKREDTHRKRLGRMLDELEDGDLYMGMPWGPDQDAAE
jgi:uncharacterized protein YdeI (YjbR/CyaY-like superfamily)